MVQTVSLSQGEIKKINRTYIFGVLSAIAVLILFIICGPVSAITFSQTGDSSGLAGQAAFVNDLVYYGGILYAGTNNGVWGWDGSSWSQLGGPSGLSDSAAVVNQLDSSEGFLYAATAGGGVWEWTGSSWSQLGGSNGLPFPSAVVVNCLLISDGKLYAGTGNGVWKWDGNSWTLIDKESGSPQVTSSLPLINSLAEWNGNLYAGTGSGVWMWNGTSWNILGDSPSKMGKYSSDVSSLYIDENILYAGTCGGVWSWDGTSWHQVGGLNGLPDKTSCTFRLIRYSGIFYAGTSYGIWEWDGSSWSQVSEFNGNGSIVAGMPENRTLVSGMVINPDGTFYAGVQGAGVWVATIPSNTTESVISESPRSHMEISGADTGGNHTIVTSLDIIGTSPLSHSGSGKSPTNQASLSTLGSFASIGVTFILIKKMKRI